MKRFFLLFFAFTLLISTHVACGKTEPTESTKESTQTEAPQTESSKEQPKDFSGKKESAGEKKQHEATSEKKQEKRTELPKNKNEPSTDEKSTTTEPTHGKDGGAELSPDSSTVDKTKETAPEGNGPRPVVKITAPKAGTLVSGLLLVKVEATVTGGPQIDKVELLIDGTKYGSTQKSPYEFSINTSILDDKEHELTAIAHSSWGNQGKASLKIITANKGPSIIIVTPQPNKNVKGKILIEAKITDPSGIKPSSVIIFLEVDGQLSQLKWSQTTPTYKASFDLTGKAYGGVLIMIKAENIKGKVKEKRLGLVHRPPVGSKKIGESCDNADAKKRCALGLDCVVIGGQKPKCFKSCRVGKLLFQCTGISAKKIYTCAPAYSQTNIGICIEKGNPPGSLYGECKTSVPCLNSKHICITSPSGGPSVCLTKCTPGQACSNSGFQCFGLQGRPRDGVCIELCGQRCKQQKDCASGQSCSSGICSGAFCQKYGKCSALAGASSKICI